MPDPQVDPSQIQGLPPGAVVKPVQAPQPIEGLPAGAVVKPLGDATQQQSSPENEQEQKPPSDPQSSWITRLGHSYATGNGAMEGSNSEVRKRLMEIAKHPIDSTTQFGKGVLDSQGELAVKAKHAWEAGDHTGAAAYALYYLMPGLGPTLAKSAEQASSGDYAGAVGTSLAAGTQVAMGKLTPAAVPAELTAETSLTKPISSGFKAAEEAVSKEKAAAVTPKPVLSTAEETVAKAKPVKEAGQAVQAEAKAVRDAKGKEIGAAKEEVKQSLPDKTAVSGTVKNPYKGDINANPEQMKFPKTGQASKSAGKVLDDLGSTKLGLKDPDMADIESIAKQFSEGKGTDGKPLSYTFEEADAERRALNAKIDSLQSKADQGGNATALKHLKTLKSGFDDDYFDMLKQHGDPSAVSNLRTLNREYAKIVGSQTDSPAAKFINKSSPEQIITDVISGGKRNQTAVQELTKNMSPEGQKVFADSVLKEMYSKATLPNGDTNMQGVQKAFSAMGDTAKAVFQKDHPSVKQYIDAAADAQEGKIRAAENGSLKSRIMRKGIQAGGAAIGAKAAGPLGAIAGSEIGGEISDALFQQGRSGAVKIGISPTEKIVLSPAEAAAKRPLITKFLSAKSAGKPAGIAAAYSALKGKNADQENNPAASL